MKRKFDPKLVKALRGTFTICEDQEAAFACNVNVVIFCSRKDNKTLGLLITAPNGMACSFSLSREEVGNMWSGRAE
jgi:hypothetical protein